MIRRAEVAYDASTLEELKVLKNKFSTMTPEQLKQAPPIQGIPAWKFAQNIDEMINKAKIPVEAEASRSQEERRLTSRSTLGRPLNAQEQAAYSPRAASAKTAEATQTFSQAELDAAKKYKVAQPYQAPDYVGKLKSAANAVGNVIGADKNAYVKNVLTQLDAGRLQQGDAIGLLEKVKSDPQIKSMLSDDQLWAIQVAAGRRV